MPLSKHAAKENTFSRQRGSDREFWNDHRGKVQIISDDYWGKDRFLPVLKGQLFREAYACMEKMPLLVSAIAVEESRVLMLNAHRVLQTCTSACDFHRRLVENLVGIWQKKNLHLPEKSTRSAKKKNNQRKVLAYLSSEAGHGPQ